MSRLEMPECETELRVFHNRLRILMSIDKHELVEAGVLAADDFDGWVNFSKCPYRFFIRRADETVAKLWALVQKREMRT